MKSGMDPRLTEDRRLHRPWRRSFLVRRKGILKKLPYLLDTVLAGELGHGEGLYSFLDSSAESLVDLDCSLGLRYLCDCFPKVKLLQVSLERALWPQAVPHRRDRDLWAQHPAQQGSHQPFSTKS